MGVDSGGTLGEATLQIGEAAAQRSSCSLNRRLSCASSSRMSLKFGSMAPQDRSGVVVVGMEVGIQDWEDEDAETNLLAIQIGGRKEGKKNMQQ
jgi:hypothetical protein